MCYILYNFYLNWLEIVKMCTKMSKTKMVSNLRQKERMDFKMLVLLVGGGGVPDRSWKRIVWKLTSFSFNLPRGVEWETTRVRGTSKMEYLSFKRGVIFVNTSTFHVKVQYYLEMSHWVQRNKYVDEEKTYRTKSND